MNHLFLIFGREPSVSFAELYQHLGQTSQKISVANREAVLVDDPEFGHTAPDILAGVVKSGLIVKTAPSLSAEILASILELHLKKEGKFNFGLSFYGFSTSLQTLPPPPPPHRGGGTKKGGVLGEKKKKKKTTPSCTPVPDPQNRSNIFNPRFPRLAIFTMALASLGGNMPERESRAGRP